MFTGLPFLFLSLCSPVIAQLSLPNPPFSPPDPSAGSEASSGYSNPQWSTLLGNLLYFYEAQRSGNLPTTNRVSWRNSSCADDGKDVGVDLSGGYYDAGDYIKVTYPLAFTLMSVCWGATDFGRGYDLASQTAYLDDMLRWGLDWLIKAHPKNDTLFVAVANPEVDNGYWGGDQNIPKPRPSFQINSTYPGTDVAAGTAAAFAACSNLYSGRGFGGAFSPPASLQNASYSQTLLTHAQQLYDFAKNAPKINSQQSVPTVAETYPADSFGDDLAIAALLLAFGTNSTSLYQESEDYFKRYKLGGQDVVFNWSSKTPGLYILFAQIAQSGVNLGGDLSTWQSEAERYLDRIVNGKGQAYLTPGGLLYYPDDSDEASLNPALNVAVLLNRYAQIASTLDKKSSYLQYSRNRVDYALGKNPMNVPYIVGSNPNSPSNPHSAMASGGSDINHIDTSPPTMKHTLYGAVIGGPDKLDNYYDIRRDWPQTEVALDYNAPMLTLVAMHVLNDTNDPFFTTLQAGEYDKVKPQGEPCDAVISDGCGKGRLSTAGKIALGVVLGVTGVTIIALLVWYFSSVRKRKTV